MTAGAASPRPGGISRSGGALKFRGNRDEAAVRELQRLYDAVALLFEHSDY